MTTVLETTENHLTAIMLVMVNSIQIHGNLVMNIFVVVRGVEKKEVGTLTFPCHFPSVFLGCLFLEFGGS